jgi:hypothetical protein
VTLRALPDPPEDDGPRFVTTVVTFSQTHRVEDVGGSWEEALASERSLAESDPHLFASFADTVDVSADAHR